MIGGMLGFVSRTAIRRCGPSSSLHCPRCGQCEFHMKLKGSIVCLVAFTLSTPAIGHLHPAHGRFMQRDPLRYKESPSLYELP
jgi:hypothetical protein